MLGMTACLIPSRFVFAVIIRIFDKFQKSDLYFSSPINFTWVAKSYKSTAKTKHLVEFIRQAVILSIYLVI